MGWFVLYPLPCAQTRSLSYSGCIWKPMLPRDTKTRNITFCGEETSQITLTAFSLLGANKSTIIKMLSKWFEIFLTLSKFHISWVDYPGQRIYHLLECLSSRKLKDSYEHWLINPYIKTCGEDQRKSQHCPVQLPSKGAVWDVRGATGQSARDRSLVNSGPKLGHLPVRLSMKKSVHCQVTFFKKYISFPWISPFHLYYSFNKKRTYQQKAITFYWACTMGHTLSLYIISFDPH